MADPLSRGRRTRAGFTLIEVLVVLGIIILVMSLLLAGMRRAHQSGQAVKCQNNLRQLMVAFRAFAQDHEDHLPGAYVDNLLSDKDPTHLDWLSGSADYQSAPQGGTLWKLNYIRNADVFLCPALDPYRPHGNNNGVGYGSNGRFDYAAFLIFDGANINSIPARSRLRIGAGQFEYHGTPILCEEGPDEINGPATEGGHAQNDRVAHNHPAAASMKAAPPAVNGVVMRSGGGHIACIDGSVEFVREPDSAGGARGTGAYLWDTTAPSGKTITLSCADNPSVKIKFGSWKDQ